MLGLELGKESDFAEEALSLKGLGAGNARNEAEEVEEESDLRWRKEGDGADNLARVGFMARAFRVFLLWILKNTR